MNVAEVVSRDGKAVNDSPALSLPGSLHAYHAQLGVHSDRQREFHSQDLTLGLFLELEYLHFQLEYSLF